MRLDDFIVKARSGVYQDTPENRRLHRVGQHYGETKQEIEDNDNYGKEDNEGKGGISGGEDYEGAVQVARTGEEGTGEGISSEVPSVSGGRYDNSNKVDGEPTPEHTEGNVGVAHRPSIEEVEGWNRQVHDFYEKTKRSAPNQNLQLAEAADFHNAIAQAKAQNPNGWMVDVHDLEDYEGYTCLVSEDGLAGVAVKPNGDIVSVFNSSPEKGFLKLLLPMAIKAGGKKLDCYVANSGRNLPNLYSQFKFTVANLIPFNEDYAPDDFAAWKEQHPNEVPKYVATMFFESTPEEVMESYDPNRVADFEVPIVDDYDEALEDRDSLLELFDSCVNEQGEYVRENIEKWDKYTALWKDKARNQRELHDFKEENRPNAAITKSRSTLTDIDIFKSFKYLRKEFRNGRWVYYYHEPKQHEKEPLKGGFGEKFKGYKGKPREAFQKLLKEQRGQIEDAFDLKIPFFYKDEETGSWEVAKRKDGKPILHKIGIDMVWGDRHEETGIEHILDKHYQKYDHFHSIEDVIDSLENTIQAVNGFNGKDSIYEPELSNKGLPKVTIKLPDNSVLTVGSRVAKVNGKEVIKHFILTSFEAHKDWRRHRTSSTVRRERIAEVKREKQR